MVPSNNFNLDVNLLYSHHTILGTATYQTLCSMLNSRSTTVSDVGLPADGIAVNSVHCSYAERTVCFVLVWPLKLSENQSGSATEPAAA